MKRKLCVVTGTRAEYGLLRYLIKQIAEDSDLELQIIATGMHLSPEFGLTYKAIEEDGWTIDDKVEMLVSSDSAVGLAKSIGLGVLGFSDCLQRLNPDIMVVLGDRFEILAAAQTAMILRIPIAHIHGGETTEGAFDESIRHAITKMAQWHFVAAEPYRKRVVQLGESPEFVYNFGAPGLDFLQQMNLMEKRELQDSLEFQFQHPLLLVTYHPATLDSQDPQKSMNELLLAFNEFPDAWIILTYPNADTGGRLLIKELDEWVRLNSNRSRAFPSLGQRRYLSLMAQADIVIGNSSSGLIEAPVLKTATVNIGDRQKGRLKAASVIQANESKESIVKAIDQALSSTFRNSLSEVRSLYGSGGASQRIKDTLKTVKLKTQKPFFNLEHEF
jgi:UDP-N-acetylglucosamine 2-epimerase (non-hydrolysing)/GDP/UDP-N,N'-diacetylbacillosamine 2-epimerase (hydrolysing)